MTTRRIIMAALAGLSLATASTQAAVLSTNFAGHANGAASDTSLNDVTTGGTWSLNTNRPNNTTNPFVPYQRDIQAENAIPGPLGDKALLLNDPNGSSGLDGTFAFATVTLDSAVDFSTNAVTWDFKTGTRRTGAGKGLRYEFLNGTTSVARLDWFDGGSLTLTGDTVDTGSSTFEFLFNWISDPAPGGVRDLSFVFDGSTLSLDFTDLNLDGLVGTGDPAHQLQSDSLSVNLASSVIDRIVVSSIATTGFDANDARGVFLDDMLVTQVPEPGSIALLGLGGLMMIKRRRRA